MRVRIFVLVQAGHDATLLILTDALLEEVCFTLEGDEFHPVERVGFVEEFRVAE